VASNVENGTWRRDVATRRGDERDVATRRRRNFHRAFGRPERKHELLWFSYEVASDVENGTWRRDATWRGDLDATWWDVSSVSRDLATGNVTQHGAERLKNARSLEMLKREGVLPVFLHLPLPPSKSLKITAISAALGPRT
jgi:hypothetical protein